MAATEQQKQFVSVFLEEARHSGRYREAARKALEMAGYGSSTSFAQVFTDEDVKRIFMDGVNLELAKMIPKLLNGLEQVVDNPALPGAKNLISAAATLLDRAGVTKIEKSEVEIKAPDGVIILPSKIKE